MTLCLRGPGTTQRAVPAASSLLGRHSAQLSLCLSIQATFNGRQAGAGEPLLSPGRKMLSPASQLGMELNRLLLLTAFLLRIQLSRMSPTGLICDRRLIQKYITEAVDLEETVSQCEELPLLQQPVHLPLVGFSLGEWMIKTNQAKGQEVLRDLVKLVDGTAAAQHELRQGCAFVLLQQLYEKAASFLLQLRNFGWQEQDSGGLPGRSSQLIPERNLRTIFQTYKQLVQGKLRFLFHDLGKDSCGGENRAANPPK